MPPTLKGGCPQKRNLKKGDKRLKTKSPKCPICKNVMNAIYTKKSYVLDGKRKFYWQKEGYLCNSFYQPVVNITSYRDMTKGKAKGNYLTGVYDAETKELFKAIDNIFIFNSWKFKSALKKLIFNLKFLKKQGSSNFIVLPFTI